jgi:hypothetical protein
LITDSRAPSEFCDAIRKAKIEVITA